MTGWTSQIREPYFRRLKTNGTLEQPGFDYVGNFYLAEEGRLLVAGRIKDPTDLQRRLYGLFLLPIADQIFGYGEKIIGDGDLALGDAEHGDTAGNSIVSFQRGGDGTIYAFDPHVNGVLVVYPEPPTFFDLEADELQYFKVIDEEIFYFGKNNDQTYLFRKRMIGDPTTDEDLLNGENIQVYHFVVVGDRIYFDGLRFADNTYIFGEIDQSNVNRLRDIAQLDSQLIGLEFYRR
jgi:hypothetical protein